jgi:hypothetical protein
MLAIALLVFSADPIDDAPSSSSSLVAVRLRIARVNGAAALEKQTIAALDDIVLIADSNATAARYQWQLVEKPAASSVALTSDEGREQRFRFFIKDRTVPGVDVAGVYRVRVDVITQAGSASDQIELHVGAGHVSSTSIAPDKPAHDTLGPQLTVAGWGAGGCLVAATALGICAFGSSFCTTGLPIVGCPCVLAGASAGACIGTTLATGSVDALMPWLPLGAGLEVLGIVLAIDGALVGFVFLRGGPDTPVPWYFTEAPMVPGLVVMGAAPITTFAVAWLSAPDEILARGHPGL